MPLNTAPQAPAEAHLRITLGGVRLDVVDESGAIGRMMDRLAASRGGWVITPNLDHLRRFRRDPRFAACFDSADLVVADGMPLIWAARLQGTPLPGRVAGSSLISTLSAAAANHGRSVFLLGGEPGTAVAAADMLRSRYPGLRIAGTACPPVGFEKDPAAFEQLRQQLIAAAPDIVFVALGSPKQEYFIEQIRADLPRSWFLGVGISFSFVAGTVKRAPRWMQKSGLEWLHRLAQEPRRLARRYLLEGLPFAALLFARVLFTRVFRRRHT